MTKLGIYFKLLRPSTLITPIVAGVFIGLMAMRTQNLQPLLNLHLLFLNCLILAMSNAVSNIWNQIWDRKLDLVIPHKRERPIPSGKIGLDNAMSIGVILLIATLALAYVTFGLYYGVLLSIILAFSWMYSSPPLRLRSRLFWGNLAIATPRGGLGVITSFSAFSNPIDSRIVLLGLALGVYVFGVNTFKDYSDYEGDLKSGVRNFCTAFGKRRASMIVTPFLYIPFLIFTLGGTLHMLMLLPFSLAITLILYRNPTLEGKGYVLWVLFYAQLTLMIVVYTIPYLD